MPEQPVQTPDTSPAGLRKTFGPGHERFTDQQLWNFYLLAKAAVGMFEAAVRKERSATGEEVQCDT